MTNPTTTGEKILHALRELGGNVSASDISRRCNVSVANVVNWIQGNATGHHIHIINTKPRRYSLQTPGHQTALQHALGYQMPRHPAPAQRHSERHPTGGSYGIHHSIGHSSAYSAMEAA